MRGLRELLLGLLLLTSAPAAAGPASVAPPVAWSLGPSAVAVYDMFPVTTGPEGEALGVPLLRTVYGHDLRDQGQYLPVSPYVEDLVAILGLRLPPRGQVSSPTQETQRFGLQDATGIEARLAYRPVADDGATVEYLVSGTFASTRTPPADRPSVTEGRTEGRVLFDRTRGVVVSSRVTLSYLSRRAGPPKGEKPAAIVLLYELRLRDIRQPRYEGFATDVAAAIDRGIDYLKSLVGPDGFCSSYMTALRVGPAALVALTLAECEVPRDDPALERALRFAVREPKNGTYEVALTLMAVERFYTPPYEELQVRAGRLKRRVRDLPEGLRTYCERLAAWLEDSRVGDVSAWGYATENGAWNSSLKGILDSSNTQYAALGLRAASRLGIPVKEKTWLGLLRWFEVMRERNAPRATVAIARGTDAKPAQGTTTETTRRTVEAAGFRYRSDGPRAYASMTTAGIAILELARSELVVARSKALSPTLEANVDRWIDGGWAWLDQHWGMDRVAETLESFGHDYLFYALYGLERAAVFSEVRTVGGKDWYFEGAAQLLARQARNGSWADGWGAPVTDTCFALLFLKRATPPLTRGDAPTGR